MWTFARNDTHQFSLHINTIRGAFLRCNAFMQQLYENDNALFATTYVFCMMRIAVSMSQNDHDGQVGGL